VRAPLFSDTLHAINQQVLSKALRAHVAKNAFLDALACPLASVTQLADPTAQLPERKKIANPSMAGAANFFSQLPSLSAIN
jgi:hypothetical protein